MGREFRLITDDWQVTKDYDCREVLTLDDRIEYRYCEVLHREDGPAVIRNDGTKEWYLNGSFKWR